MNARLMVRMVLPIMALSAIPLLLSAGFAWKVHTSQKKVSTALAFDVTGIRAGEELAIGIRDVRTQLEHFLLTHDRKHLDAVAGLREQTDPWLAEAERAAVTPEEQQLIDRVKKGYGQFFREFDRLARAPAGTDIDARVRSLIKDPLTAEILLPSQDYLDFNEKEIEASNAGNQRVADRMVVGLLLLGICGPLSGLVAGFGIARGVSRSIGRLSVPIRDAAGKLNEFVAPITLSARWNLEDMEVVLRQIADQVGALIERLQQSQREVLRVEQLAAVGQMAAGIAHELRNPLMSMKISVQAAAERHRSVLLEDLDLEDLEEEITRMERAIQTLLDFARPPQLETGKFELRTVVRQTVDLVSARARQQGVTIDCELPDRPVVISADVGQVRQVALNLLLNALDATPEGGSIRVRVAVPESGGRGQESEVRGQKSEVRSQRSEVRGEESEQWLMLSVADTGCGLPAGLGPRIFEPFVSTKPTGIGLGLSICKRIVEAHGGQLTAAAAPGGGAVFTVRLPVMGQ